MYLGAVATERLGKLDNHNFATPSGLLFEQVPENIGTSKCVLWQGGFRAQFEKLHIRSLDVGNEFECKYQQI